MEEEGHRKNENKNIISDCNNGLARWVYMLSAARDILKMVRKTFGKR